MILHSGGLPFNSSVLSGRFRMGKPHDLLPTAGRRWLLITRGGVLIDRSTASPTYIHADPFPLIPSPQNDLINLGMFDGHPLVAAVLDFQPDSSRFTVEPYNAHGDCLPPEILSLAGIASALHSFDRTNRFCGRCGADTSWAEEEWAKKCTCCGHVAYPSPAPCVIVLVHRGDEILLVRKPGWPEGRYSLVAGFVTMGESVEECASREVLEETGVRIDGLEYVASQFWPFPLQLMIGMSGRWSGGSICRGDGELEDARWFPVNQLACSLPGKRSIARMLIDRFVARFISSPDGE